MTTYGSSGASSVGSSSGTGSGRSTGSPGTTDIAKEQAGQVGQTAKQAGTEVAATAKDQAQTVATEAKQQARDLAGEARGQLTDQANTQVNRAAKTLRSFGDELEEMASSSQQNGLASELVRQAATRTKGLAGYLEQREPADLVDDLRTVARRRPAAFLLGAALAGVAAGRLTRGVQAASSSSTPQRGQPTSYGTSTANRQPAAYPASATTTSTLEQPRAGLITDTDDISGRVTR